MCLPACSLTMTPCRHARHESLSPHAVRRKPGFVNRIALCELVWSIVEVHDYRRTEIASIIEKLLGSEGLILEDDEAVRSALRSYAARNVDFADALIGAVNRLRGCDATATFDRKAARLDGFIRVT